VAYSGAHDIEHAVKLFKSYFKHYSVLEPKILVDHIDA
jgi:aspartyl aminopeptidase